MNRIIFLIAFLLISTAGFSQELVLTPILLKSAPAEATKILVAEKKKPKKAKWFVAQTGVYMADFQKKKASKIAYYFTPQGSLLYKRTPLKEEELPKELLPAVGDRMKGPGTKLYLFEGAQGKFYCVTVPTGDNTSVSQYFTSYGQPFELKFK